MVGEPQVAAGIAGRLSCLMAPLQQALGVGEAAGFLGVCGGREEEHLRADVLGAHLTGLDLLGVLPPGGALDHDHVPDYQPVQVGHAQPLHPRVSGADGRVLAEQEVALAGSVELHEHRVVRAVAAGQSRDVVVAEVVAGRRRVAPPCFEQAHQVLAGIGPESPRHRLVLDIRLEIVVTVGERHGQVARQQVKQGRDVR